MKTYENQCVAEIYPHHNGYRGLLMTNPGEDNQYTFFTTFSDDEKEAKRKLRSAAYAQSMDIIAWWGT